MSAPCDHLLHYCTFAPLAPCAHALGTFGHGHLEAFCCCVPLASCGVGACVSCSGRRMAEKLCAAGRGESPNRSVPVAVVTGANRTLGFEVASILAQRGHAVCLLCRDKARGEAAAERIASATGNRRVFARAADLSDLGSIERFCAAFRSGGEKGKGDEDEEDEDLAGRGVSMLVNNAGLIGEESVRINHLGHMALTLGLLEPLRKAAGTAAREGGAAAGGGRGKRRLLGVHSTVTTVASCAHASQVAGLGARLAAALAAAPASRRLSTNAWEAYSDSKAANVLFARALARRLGRFGVTSTSLHPGVLLTDLWRPPSSHPPPSPVSSSSSSSSSSPSSSLSSPSSSSSSTSSTSSTSWAPRVLFSLCVKHPKVSATFIAALADPRCCLTSAHNCDCGPFLVGDGGSYFQQAFCCCAVPVRSLLSLTAAPPPARKNSLKALTATDANDAAAPLTGAAPMQRGEISSSEPLSLSSNGGGMGVVDDDESDANATTNDEEMLWRASMAALERESPGLLALAPAEALLLPSDRGSGGCSGNILVEPAWPCTEFIAAAPLSCFCVSCLC